VETGAVVQVSAMYDPVAGVYNATRVAPAASGAVFEVRGVVGPLAGTTFQIGTQLFEAQGVWLPAGFAPGMLVRVEVRGPADGADRWIVAAVEEGVSLPPDGESGVLRGAVGVQADATHVVVEGVPVDASTAAFHPSKATLAPGLLVQVTGTMNAGTLVASRVDFKVNTKLEVGAGQGSEYGGDAFEVDGAIEGPVDPETLVFTMRGPTTVDASEADFEGGTADDLAPGRVVQVYGILSDDGTTLVAETVTFVD
jgi:hypothetical protein